MIGRVVHSADFQRLLASPARARSVHFAVHHVDTAVLARPAAAQGPGGRELSTVSPPTGSGSVDKTVSRHALGTVLPKRHARRAVTRNLLRRQIRHALIRHAHRLPEGQWLVRLRSPFPRSDFASAASDALRRAARAELDAAFLGVSR